MRLPKNVMPGQTGRLRKRLAELGIEIPEDHQIFVTNTNRGRFDKRNYNVTVPLWAFEAGVKGLRKHEGNPEYAIYYACHEIAHILAPGGKHGPKFMAEFMRICPDHLHRFELEYKPRNAMAAGISA